MSAKAAQKLGAGPVVGDDLDGRLLLELGDDGGRVALGQQFDRAVLIQVDDDRAVLVPASQRLVVDTDVAGGGHPTRRSSRSTVGPLMRMSQSSGRLAAARA